MRQQLPTRVALILSSAFLVAWSPVTLGGGTPVSGVTNFCDTSPASTAQFCDDFEEGLACQDSGRTIIYTDQVGSVINCASSTDPIDGSYSLEYTKGADDEIWCDDGGGSGCFGANMGTGIICLRFTLRIDVDGNSNNKNEDVMVMRTQSDGESFWLGVDPRDDEAQVDYEVVIIGNSTIGIANAGQEGVEKIWCMEKNMTASTNTAYSGADCGVTEAAPDYNTNSGVGGFRVRARLNNSNVHIDNIVVHNAGCQATW